MDQLAIILAILLTPALAFLGLLWGKAAAPGSSDEEMATLRETAKELENKLVETLSENHKFASRGQIASLTRQTQNFSTTIAEQKALLSTIRERLDKARADVEARERAQQEIRSIKEEDESAIVEVVANYDRFSTESVTLEHKLAESLRTLDAMASEIQMSADQQAVFHELSNALTATSAQLRDVIVDYQNAHERLENLRRQYQDLENEYTKLVEQQLGS